VPSSEHNNDVASRARDAIGRGDRGEALRLLHALVSAHIEGTSDLTPVTADALVAVATGSSDEPDLVAVAAYVEVQATYHAIAEQIRRAALEREHIASLRALLDARERELDKQADARRLQENSYQASMSLRRVGNGWLEVKWIPRASGKVTGPYLYYRVREGGHLRSRYIGKTTT
jgi:hypothetical protein